MRFRTLRLVAETIDQVRYECELIVAVTTDTLARATLEPMGAVYTNMTPTGAIRRLNFFGGI